jgi:hypothetical protein
VDYAHRTEAEARLARAIARLGASQRRRLLEIMGDPPKLENVGAEFWNGHYAEWRGLLTPELERIFVDSAGLLMDALPGLGVDWTLVNQAAVNWARQHGDEVARRIYQTTEDGVGDAVADFYEQSLNMGQLREKLGRWFSTRRAATIATTETTRAAVEGERELVRELGAQGIIMAEIWQTNNDELVCPQCGPRHNQQIMDGIYPPLHPNCRCWITHEIAGTL